jgi:hypothetical protein
MDTQKAVEIVMQATKQLLDDVEATTNAEADEYSKGSNYPKQR